VSWPIVDGIGPLSWLNPRSKDVSLLSLPIVDGIGPFKEFTLRLLQVRGQGRGHTKSGGGKVLGVPATATRASIRDGGCVAANRVESSVSWPIVDGIGPFKEFAERARDVSPVSWTIVDGAI